MTSNLGPEHHNTMVEIPPTVRHTFILTHLAWAIFQDIRNFLIGEKDRLVTLRQGIGEARDIKEREWEVLCRVLGRAPRGRSNSLKKRGKEEDAIGGVANTTVTL